MYKKQVSNYMCSLPVSRWLVGNLILVVGRSNDLDLIVLVGNLTLAVGRSNDLDLIMSLYFRLYHNRAVVKAVVKGVHTTSKLITKAV